MLTSHQKRSFKRWFAVRSTRLLGNLQPSQSTALVGTALLVGLGAAGGGIIFRWLIDSIWELSFTGGAEFFGFLGSYYVIVIPAVGGLFVGPIIYFFAREAKGHGVPEVMEAVALRGGRIRPVVVIVKSLASSICIGTGGAVGREGPIVQIGSAIGSTVGQVLRLSDERIRTLVACGAAGGIAVTFNAPIAGVIFTLEVILGEFKASYLSMVVISAVVAGAVGHAVFGNTPAFVVPAYSLVSPWELILYAILGGLAAIIGVTFISVLYRFEDICDAWEFPEYFKPALGGLVIGGMGFFFPQIFGVGYQAIEQALHNQAPLLLMFGLLIIKMVATSLTIGSGGSGGVFAPSLFLGAMLGGSFGSLVHGVFPTFTAESGAYALVGMAGVFAAAGRAPITAILMLFEMTGDYQIILPLMLCSVLSASLANRMQPETIYTLKLSRRGVNLEQGKDLDVMETVQVGEAMTTSLETVPTTMPLQELAAIFERTHHHGFPVLDPDGQLFGVISISDLERAISEEDRAELTAGDIATAEFLVAYPDESMSTAIRRMAPGDLSRLPVVDRANPRKLLGLVRRSDLLKAYRLVTMKREERRRRMGRLGTG